MKNKPCFVRNCGIIFYLFYQLRLLTHGNTYPVAVIKFYPKIMSSQRSCAFVVIELIITPTSSELVTRWVIPLIKDAIFFAQCIYKKMNDPIAYRRDIFPLTLFSIFFPLFCKKKCVSPDAYL